MDFKLDEVEILLVGEMLLLLLKKWTRNDRKKIKILRKLRVGAEKKFAETIFCCIFILIISYLH